LGLSIKKSDKINTRFHAEIILKPNKTIMRFTHRFLGTKKDFSRLILILFPSLFISLTKAWAGIYEISSIHAAFQSFIPFISSSNYSNFLLETVHKSSAVTNLCTSIDKQFQFFSWEKKPCGEITWETDFRTIKNNPLLYATFGSGPETTIIISGVHPDELTPIPIAFRLARYLQSNPQIIPKNSKVVVAPLVNPDGFLLKTPVRINTNGIDLNRNFFTLDWFEKAQQIWEQRRKKLLSHFPGYLPNSEVETIFQIQLIDRFKPHKIMSIHAPLGFLDYDGPGDGERPQQSDFDLKAKELVLAVSQKSKNYKVVDFRFYPGSLGNYAGHERLIPTVTLELESTDPRKLNNYWNQFLPGILESITYDLPNSPLKETRAPDLNASPFSIQYQQAGLKKTI
jgi:protein MpaA